MAELVDGGGKCFFLVEKGVRAEVKPQAKEGAKVQWWLVYKTEVVHCKIVGHWK